MQSAAGIATSERPSSITFVCCVEAGPLEIMTLRLVESLRRWGGTFANAPVFAVTPRSGPPIAASTRDAFRRLGVEYALEPKANPIPWFPFFNKTAAARFVEKRASTDLCAWIDGDILITGDVGGFALDHDVDFQAQPDRMLCVTESDRSAEPYWRGCCETLGISFDQLPDVRIPRTEDKMRMNWQGGLFVWRRATGYAREWERDNLAIFNARVSSNQFGTWYMDQMVLALTGMRLGLRWRELPIALNYGVTRYLIEQDLVGDVGSAQVIHYHDCAWPDTWPRFLSLLRPLFPEVHEWLMPQGPIVSETNLATRLNSSIRKRVRARRLRRFEATCSGL